MLDVVVFKWGDRYRWEHVRRLRDQVREHLPLRHRFTVLTDDLVVGEAVMGPEARVLPIRHREWIGLGNAYPKLQLFDPYFPADRILALDLDVTIVGNLLPLVARQETLVVLEEFDYTPREGRVRGRYNTSVILLDVGAAPGVYRRFAERPAAEVERVKRSRVIGSDQAYLHLELPGDTATFGACDGVRSYRFDVLPNGRRPDDKIIVYHGKPKPWTVDGRADSR